MANKFEKFYPSLESPARSIFEITPNDSTDLDSVPRAIGVRASGDVQVTMLDGTIGILHIVAGGPQPVQVVRVWATNTTATGIHGLF